MSDTTLTVARMQLAAQRRLTGEQRLALAFEMSRLARELLIARVGQEHPNWSRRQIEREVLRSAFLTERPSAELPLPLR